MNTRQTRRLNPLYAFGGACALIALSSSPAKAAPRAECAQLNPMFLESVKQLKATQAALVAAACHEHPESPDCKRLSLSGQEMMSALQMLTLKMKASGCDPSEPTRGPLNSCERLSLMIEKADQKLTELKAQATAQRCALRGKAPVCRALRESKQQSLGLIRAAEAKRLSQGCDAERSEPQKSVQRTSGTGGPIKAP